MMKSKIERYVVAAAAATLSLALSACPGAAVPRQKAINVQAGTPTRVSNHTYFKASTCQAPAVPKVVVRRKPTKGVLKVNEGVLPLRRASTERGEKCVGKPMRTAIVQYTASPKASGEDSIAYDVIFPSSCKRCTNYEVTVTISISADAPPPPTSTAPGDDGDG